MFKVAVVPAYNEETRISKAIETLLKTSIDKILVIEDGTDKTQEIVSDLASREPRVVLMRFEYKLGIDVPRAVGFGLAVEQHNADFVLLFDGDLIGAVSAEVDTMLDTAIKNNYDLLMHDCYPEGEAKFENLGFVARRYLTNAIGEPDLLYCNPLHGLLVVSKNMIRVAPSYCWSIPAIGLAYAKKNGFKFGIGLVMNYKMLESAIRTENHVEKILDLIAGDCREAECVYLGIPRDRIFQGRECIGYNNERCF